MNAIIVNSLEAWLLAFRLRTLGATVCPIIIGSAFAYVHHSFVPGIFITTLFVAVLLQVLANVVNDYGDYIKGSDTADRLGPPRAMQMGLISQEVMERGIKVILLVTLFLGSFLVWRGGVLVLLAGLLGTALCLFYSLGSKPLAYLGLIEIIIFFVFGPAEVLGSYYIEVLHYCPEALAFSVSPGFLASALSLTNNLRDIKEDSLHNKRTLAVRIGERWARRIIVMLLVLSFLGPIILVAHYSYSFIVLFSCAALFVPFFHVPMILQEPITKRFNLMLKSLGQTLYLFGLLSSIVIIYGAP